MPLEDQVSEAIRKVVTQQLAPTKIVDVKVSEDTDHDGDPILRIVVVFDGDRLEPQKVVGLTRHLREPFQKLQEHRFPMFSFKKPSEIDGAAA